MKIGLFVIRPTYMCFSFSYSHINASHVFSACDWLRCHACKLGGTLGALGHSSQHHGQEQ